MSRNSQILISCFCRVKMCELCLFLPSFSIVDVDVHIIRIIFEDALHLMIIAFFLSLWKIQQYPFIVSHMNLTSFACAVLYRLFLSHINSKMLLWKLFKKRTYEKQNTGRGWETEEAMRKILIYLIVDPQCTHGLNIWDYQTQ